VAVPNLVKLETELDKSGVPHLKGRFAHWRPNAGWQDERQMSDGTIRLLALLWILDEGEQPLLLEEPELSLNPAVVREIPRLVHNVQKRRSRQVILSTHSPDLLSDEGIDLAEILLVRPGKDGSEVMVADDIENAQDLLESGASPADVVMPLTQPRELHQGLLPYTP
jgi:predicted ATPase